jgi:predicted LPLAT superfamily acyltransferase/glycosyltransferase involved in cell wall biosynthesis
MSFNPCAVVPCYNHGATVAAVVERLRAQGLPVIVVDDGSDAETARLLDSLSGMHLFRLPRNRGKGAAVVRGLREAAQLGFTHALQVDADGQHDLGDVPRFLERGQAAPDALVCAEPYYDGSIPNTRRIGKKITDFWVALETLGAARGDSMCGFRLYPLALTVPIVRRRRLPRGMSFDIDVMVRLIWAGAGMETVRTRVTYPADGVSHFRMLRDNLRISHTHAHLFIGMLARLPRWLLRGFTWHKWWQPTHWSRLAERGSLWGLRLVAATLALLGREAARIVMLPAVAWFFITGREARRASRTYLARLGEHSGQAMPRPTAWNVWRHMLAFADASLDRLAAWRGEIADATVEFQGAEEFARLARERRGALLIGSHLGNLEMIRALAVTRGRATVTAVVYTDHARRFAATLSGANRRFAENLFEVRDFGPQTAILLKERVERGEILVIVGDRTPAADNGRRSHASFLGRDAPFPQGPVVLGYLLGCPVYLFFCLKEEKRQGSRYRIHLEPFAERIELPHRGRKAAIDAYVARYAQRLECYCREAPLQWFNFFDFWHEPLGGR